MRRRYRGTLALAMLLFAGCERGCGCDSDRSERAPARESSSSSSSGCGGGTSGGGCGSVDLSGDGGSCWFCTDDVAPPRDSTIGTYDSGPSGCINPYVESTTCEKPLARPGGTACTDSMIRALTSCFRGKATECYAAREAYRACASCMLEDRGDGGAPAGWIEVDMIDQGACINAIDPASSCGTTVNCTWQCIEEACIDCLTTPGSGVGGDRSEWDNCLDTVIAPAQLTPTDAATETTDADVGDAVEDTLDADAVADGESAADGAVCFRIAANRWAACASEPRFRPCFVHTYDDVLPFFRGACRDGADWSRAYVADGTDDSGTDAHDAAEDVVSGDAPTD